MRLLELATLVFPRPDGVAGIGSKHKHKDEVQQEMLDPSVPCNCAEWHRGGGGRVHLSWLQHMCLIVRRGDPFYAGEVLRP